MPMILQLGESECGDTHSCKQNPQTRAGGFSMASGCRYELAKPSTLISSFSNASRSLGRSMIRPYGGLLAPLGIGMSAW